MSFEIDWHRVGEESSSGDCISMRFGDFVKNPSSQRVVVIDGGFKKNGGELVEFIRNQYGTGTVDLVISTHPDMDHLSGLFPVIENMNVKALWMHQPWERQEDIKEYVTAGTMTKRQFSESAQKSFRGAKDLADLAALKEIPITEPFCGLQAFDGVITVAGPTEDYYNEMIVSVDSTSGAGGLLRTAAAGLVEAAKAVVRWITETWKDELLAEPADDATSPRNNSSVVTLFKSDGDVYLFTADVGVAALTAAVDYIEANGVDPLKDVDMIQIPHHGSRRNIGPTLLDRLFGPKLVEGGEPTNRRAAISAAAKGAPKHPNGRVTNAITRRGARVYSTSNQALWSHSIDAPERDKFGPAIVVPFQTTYEDTEPATNAQSA